MGSGDTHVFNPSMWEVEAGIALSLRPACLVYYQHTVSQQDHLVPTAVACPTNVYNFPNNGKFDQVYKTSHVIPPGSSLQIQSGSGW